jgi:hypothetical protein
MLQHTRQAQMLSLAGRHSRHCPPLFFSHVAGSDGRTGHDHPGLLHRPEKAAGENIQSQLNVLADAFGLATEILSSSSGTTWSVA